MGIRQFLLRRLTADAFDEVAALAVSLGLLVACSALVACSQIFAVVRPAVGAVLVASLAGAWLVLGWQSWVVVGRLRRAGD
jgi:hypothetical protein